MSNNSKFVSNSLAELLSGIADGIREAQESLSNIPSIDIYGRPMPTYHLPYVDFQLQIDLDTQETQSGIRQLKIIPARNISSQTSLHSNISGRFVAIPPGEGLPVPQIELQLSSESTHLFRADILLTNTAGEIITNAAVELNIDTAASKALSLANGKNITTLGATALKQAILTTDHNGQAHTLIELDNKLPNQAFIVITADYGMQSTSATLVKAE
jgi:hypothetical protein